MRLEDGRFIACEFQSHPEWPVYEAPARWYVIPNSDSMANKDRK